MVLFLQSCLTINQDQELYELVKTHQLHNTQKHVENIKTLNLDFL